MDGASKRERSSRMAQEEYYLFFSSVKGSYAEGSLQRPQLQKCAAIALALP
jgi:hypothetical protein